MKYSFDEFRYEYDEDNLFHRLIVMSILKDLSVGRDPKKRTYFAGDIMVNHT